MNAIEVDSVSKNYGAFNALIDLDFKIEQGEFFGLLGPNGAGKSTLISCMSGLMKPSSGIIRIAGHDVVEDYRQSRRLLGVVPQEIVFDPFFTVREALNLQLGYMGLKERQHRDWIEELLHTLGLNDKANSKTGTLSGGMKRRVLIAQALVHRPPVVVLDEPTAGVDVELRKSLWSFAKRLNSDGHTIVLTTHYLEEAEALCDRIAIIDRGKLRALETKTEMLLRHTYSFLTVKTIGEAVPPSQLRDKLVSSSSGELRFKIDKQHDAIIGLLDQLKVAGIEVEDIETRNPGLEDVFVELTGAIDIDE